MRIRMQADDFYNTYLVLNKVFRDELTAKEESSGRVLSTFGPSVVCLAFSVELYIKNLYSILDKKAPRTHNILKLFEGLPEDIRQKVFDHKSIGQTPWNGDIFNPKRYSGDYSSEDRVVDEIKAISDGFEKWRYSHEHTNLRYNKGFALAFIKALTSVADANTDARV